jgi:hypothetical protein
MADGIEDQLMDHGIHCTSFRTDSRMVAAERVLLRFRHSFHHSRLASLLRERHGDGLMELDLSMAQWWSS